MRIDIGASDHGLVWRFVPGGDIHDLGYECTSLGAARAALEEFRSQLRDSPELTVGPSPWTRGAILVQGDDEAVLRLLDDVGGR